MNDLRFSRPLATAARLGDLAPGRHQFTDKRVLLSGEPAILGTTNGRSCFLNSLRLLVRICSNVTLSVPSVLPGLLAECKQVADHAVFSKRVEFAESAPGFGRFEAILSVGTQARPNLPWTSINSNGWLARVSSGSTHLNSECEHQNPIGALAAASLGVAEVFKRLICLKESRGRLLDGSSFSLFSYSAAQTNPGPSLPEVLPVNSLLIVGVGAIGNGIVHLLSELPFRGRISFVDNQPFQTENLGTCILIGPADLGNSKAEFGAKALKTPIQAQWYGEDFAVFRDRLGKEIPYPDVVVNGLDNIEARHQAQDLWPDLIIDGAIGDLFCQASCHPWGPDVACLKCLFREPVGESAEIRASRATGLSEDRVRHALGLVSDQDVQTAQLEKQEWLRARVGRQICSVIQEAVAQELSKERLPENFEPSIPFVACLSASMVVAELVKFVAGWPTQLEPRFQFDILRGPDRGELFPQGRRPDCVCVTRRHNIELVRANRRYN